MLFLFILVLLLALPSEPLSVLFFSLSLPTADQRKTEQGKKSKWPRLEFSFSLPGFLGLGSRLPLSGSDGSAGSGSWPHEDMRWQPRDGANPGLWLQT